MGMHDPHSDEYRPYVPNEATPIPRPVIHAVDIQAAIEAERMEAAEVVEPEGDADWAIDATKHVEAERERIGADPDGDDLPNYEAPTAADTDDYGNPERHRGEPWDAPDADGATVAMLPAENGADLEDADPGFISGDDAHEHENGGPDHTHGDDPRFDADGNYLGDVASDHEHG